MENKVLSLPMRNWNTINYHFFPIASFLFWVYLWGIETYIVSICYAGYIYVLSLPMRNWNPCPGSHSVHVAHRFESTYEELKLVFYTYLENPELVLSLPMRNWNEEYEKMSKDERRFWVYLWGIETYNPLSFPVSLHLRFWVYLWGIETFFNFRQQRQGIFVLSLPMRNWNPVSSVTNLPMLKFWVYLWGM